MLLTLGSHHHSPVISGWPNSAPTLRHTKRPPRASCPGDRPPAEPDYKVTWLEGVENAPMPAAVRARIRTGRAAVGQP